MELVRVDWNRKRLWVLGRRLHHHTSGFALMVMGAWLMYDDRADLALLFHRHPVPLPLFDPEVGVTTTNRGVW